MFDTFITIAVLALLAFPILAIVALVIAIQARDLARRQAVRLNEFGVRLAYLATPGPPQPMPAPISLPAEPPPLEQVLQPEHAAAA